VGETDDGEPGEVVGGGEEVEVGVDFGGVATGRWTPDLGGPQRREARMGRPGKYPVEFRRAAIELVRSSGRPVAEVPRSLDIAEGALWNWVKADRETRRPADPHTGDGRQRHQQTIPR
jgi:hypothetical protein